MPNMPNSLYAIAYSQQPLPSNSCPVNVVLCASRTLQAGVGPDLQTWLSATAYSKLIWLTVAAQMCALAVGRVLQNQ